ncbi:MAG: hypothetical protein K0M40_13400 [Prolixibacteraceae bacterium]|nr:hypothetical protein [Prolixibacteraceae bacterium]
MRSVKVKLVFFLFFLIHAGVGFAQQPELEFSPVKAFEKFSSSQFMEITQDSVGYLWIGTVQGLLRFDGQSISTYLHVANDPNSLPGSKIDKLFVDRGKNIWICTNGGLCKYNPELDNFSPIITETNLRGASGLYISAIAEDKSGQLYIASQNTIYKLDNSQNLFSKVTELTEGKINALVFDDQNNIWIGASYNGGLFYFNQKENQLTSYFNNPNSKQSISNNEIVDLALVNGNLWIATYGGGVDTYNPELKSFKHYISPYYFENYPLSIFTDSRKNIWISTLGGLKLFDPSTENFYNYYHDPNNPKSLRKHLWRFFEDKQGNYWTVQSIGGISVAKSNNKFKHFNSQSSNGWRTSENNITSISNDRNGNLWIGNYYNGIDIFYWKENKTDRYIHKDNDSKSLGNGTIFSIFRDSKHQMWIGSNMGGLQRFNPKSKNFDTYTNNPNDTTSIANNDIRSISEDANGDIWCVTHGKGVDRFDTKTKTFHHYNSKNNHLSNDYAFQVLNDSKGNLWVTTVYGLNLLKNGELIFKTFVSVPNDSTSINGNEIRSIHEDQKHNIWVSTSEGLNKYNPETESFTRHSYGLINKNIVSIISDRKNNIWVSTTSGISKLDPLTDKFINFDQSDGLISTEYNRQSSFIDDQNTIFFGGQDGIDLFNPDSLIEVLQQPKLIFTDFRVFNKSISFLNDSHIIDKHISHANNVVLKYLQNSISFHYQGLDLTNSDKITYAYKLDGFDKNWINAGQKLEANYTNLEPGKYTFRVKAKYEDGDWGKKEISVELRILPEWWMTIWFRILVGLIVLAVTFGAFYWRIKLLNNQREKLEKLVIDRTNEIQNKNDQLKALNATKDKLFSIISHDLRSPFNTILGFQDLLLNDYHELSDSDRLEMIRQVHTTTNQVYDLVENLLNWSGIQTSNIKYQPAKVDLKELILDKLDLYRNIAESKGIKFNYQIPDSLFAYADIHLLETSLRNLTNNAIKFTSGGGTILIKASRQHDVIEISVTDSGTGMAQEQIDTLFDIENIQTKSGTNGEKGSGLGLLLCKEFVGKNKGTFNVKSQLGKGSTFSFTLPAFSQE